MDVLEHFFTRAEWALLAGEGFGRLERALRVQPLRGELKSAWALLPRLLTTSVERGEPMYTVRALLARLDRVAALPPVALSALFSYPFVSLEPVYAQAEPPAEAAEATEAAKAAEAAEATEAAKAAEAAEAAKAAEASGAAEAAEAAEEGARHRWTTAGRHEWLRGWARGSPQNFKMALARFSGRKGLSFEAWREALAEADAAGVDWATLLQSKDVEQIARRFDEEDATHVLAWWLSRQRSVDDMAVAARAFLAPHPASFLLWAAVEPALLAREDFRDAAAAACFAQEDEAALMQLERHVGLAELGRLWPEGCPHDWRAPRTWTRYESCDYFIAPIGQPFDSFEDEALARGQRAMARLGPLTFAQMLGAKVGALSTWVAEHDAHCDFGGAMAHFVKHNLATMRVFWAENYSPRTSTRLFWMNVFAKVYPGRAQRRLWEELLLVVVFDVATAHRARWLSLEGGHEQVAAQMIERLSAAVSPRWMVAAAVAFLAQFDDYERAVRMIVQAQARSGVEWREAWEEFGAEECDWWASVQYELNVRRAKIQFEQSNILLPLAPEGLEDCHAPYPLLKRWRERPDLEFAGEKAHMRAAVNYVSPSWPTLHARHQSCARALETLGRLLSVEPDPAWRRCLFGRFPRGALTARLAVLNKFLPHEWRAGIEEAWLVCVRSAHVRRVFGRFSHFASEVAFAALAAAEERDVHVRPALAPPAEEGFRWVAAPSDESFSAVCVASLRAGERLFCHWEYVGAFFDASSSVAPARGSFDPGADDLRDTFCGPCVSGSALAWLEGSPVPFLPVGWAGRGHHMRHLAEARWLVGE